MTPHVCICVVYPLLFWEVVCEGYRIFVKKRGCDGGIQHCCLCNGETRTEREGGREGREERTKPDHNVSLLKKGVFFVHLPKVGVTLTTVVVLAAAFFVGLV